MKNIKSIGLKRLFLFMPIIVLGMFLLTGCASGAVSYYVTNFPNRLVYQIGEQVDFSGLSIETTNSDGTHTMVRLNSTDYPQIDTSVSGEKKVKITKGKLSTSFNIYVADVVVNDSDDIKSIFSTLNAGDIIYMRAGNYMPKSNEDLHYKNIEIVNGTTIIGDGADKTNFYGNFIIGAKSNGTDFEKIANFENIKIMNIGFKLNYTIKDELVQYSGPYGKTDTNGAIRCFDTKKIFISGCKFSGYGYGINAESTDGLTVQNCSFRWIFKSAIYTSKETKNTLIYKNIFMDIASNVISFDGDKLASVGACELSFGSSGVAGVNICKNTFTRIALKNSSTIYYDELSKQNAQKTDEQLYKLTYIN